MRRSLIALLSWLWFSAGALANVPCTLPFNLQNGTTADATQVMANYNALVTCLTNAAAAGVNTDITALLGLTTPITPAGGGSSTYYGGTSAGTANAQTIATPSPLGFSLAAGKTIVFIAGFSNTLNGTTGTQINVNSLGLTNIYRRSPSGPQLMTGGEIVAGNLVVATYDGTQFELLDAYAQVGGYGPLTTLASATTTDLGTIASHNASITGTTAITSFGASASLTYPKYKVVFTGALVVTYNQTSCSTTGGCILTPGSANITTQANDTAELTFLGVGSGGPGNWSLTNYQRANGTAVVNPTPLCGLSGLVIQNNSGTPNTNIDYSAASATLLNPTGNVPIFGTSISGTINTTNGTVTSTADGMDGEARPTSAFGFVYVISDGTNFKGLVSTSATTPTMPANYIYRCLAGTMRYDGSQNQWRTRQLGADQQYTVVPTTNTAALPQPISGTSGSVTVPTYTTASLSSIVPSIATRVRGSAYLTATSGGVSTQNLLLAPNGNYGNNTNLTNPPPIQLRVGVNANTNSTYGSFDWLLETTSLFYTADTATSYVAILGWKNAVNAN